jgi:hypothetical protein
VKVEHDENSAISCRLDDLVHNLERGETLQIGVGTIIDAGGGSVVDGQRQVEGQLHRCSRLALWCDCQKIVGWAIPEWH